MREVVTMSLYFARNDVQRTQKEIESLRRQLVDETKKEADRYDKILKVRRSITSSTSESSLRSKTNEINRYEYEIVSIQKKKIELEKKIADKTSQLFKYQQKLSEEESKESAKNQKKMLDDLERKRELEKQDYERRLKELTQPINRSLQNNVIEVEYDAFISHASEDKVELVRPIAEKLKEAGFSVWYDEFELKIGDSLSRSIDKGLANSRFGIVVLSPSFFAKKWTAHELSGLVAKEMEGGKVILPLWHKVSKNEVMKYSPTLADKLALNTTQYTIDELVKELSDVLK